MSDPEQTLQSAPEPAPDIAGVLNEYTIRQQAAMFRLRSLIYETATQTDLVGALDESLKWGQPSYTPRKKRVGSSVRLGVHGEETVALYFICHTHMVDRFREIYPDQFAYEGNRAIILPNSGRWPEAALKHCIAMALTWHLQK